MTQPESEVGAAAAPLGGYSLFSYKYVSMSTSCAATRFPSFSSPSDSHFNLNGSNIHVSHPRTAAGHAVA